MVTVEEPFLRLILEYVQLLFHFYQKFLCDFVYSHKINQHLRMKLDKWSLVYKRVSDPRAEECQLFLFSLQSFMLSNFTSPECDE